MATLNREHVSTAAQRQAEHLEAQQRRVRSEATRRINSRWNDIGQRNTLQSVIARTIGRAADALYTVEECEDCNGWVKRHKDAAQALLARDDLAEIDVTADEWWE